MKRAVLFIICLLMLAGLPGCGKNRSGDPSASGGEPIVIATPQPHSTAEGNTAETSQPTEQPSEQPTPQLSETPTETPTETPEAVPTQEPRIPSDVEEAVAMYEGYPVGYDRIYRDDAPLYGPIPEPRFTMGEDGIYRSSEANGDNEAVIMLTGDLMCQTRQQLAAKTDTTYDFRGEFYYVKDLFAKADFVIGNLEASISPTAPYMSERSYVDGSPHLNCPITYLDAVRYAGYDMVVMSNNHNCDLGVRGIYDTLDRVDKFKLMHTGVYRNANECRYIVADIDGIRVGFLSYSTYFNHKEEHLSNEGREAMLNTYSKERLSGDVEKVRAAGAEYVIVYIHWGVEYESDPGRVEIIPFKEKSTGLPITIRVPMDQQYELAQEIADSGVDYIIGSHPHAIQPYDVLTSSDGRKVPIIYSMGNFTSHQKKDVSKDTMILRIVLSRGANGRIELTKEGYVPARMHVSYGGRSYTILPLTYPYRKDNMSDQFAPAYFRITKVVGSKLTIMGTF